MPPGGRSPRQWRAIFARLGRSRPVRRIAVGGAIVGGLYGIHRVRKAYKKYRTGTLDRAFAKIRAENEKNKQHTLEFHRKLGTLPVRRMTASQKRQAELDDSVMIMDALKKKYPTLDSALQAQHPHLKLTDPVTPKTSDSVAQAKIAEQKEIEERASRYIGEDIIERGYRVRRVPPRSERTQDVASRMRQGRRRRRDDY